MALTKWTFVGRVMSLLLHSRLHQHFRQKLCLIGYLLICSTNLHQAAPIFHTHSPPRHAHLPLAGATASTGTMLGTPTLDAIDLLCRYGLLWSQKKGGILLMSLSFYFCSPGDDPTPLRNAVGQFLLCRQQTGHAQQGRLFLQWRTLRKR